MGEEKKMVIVRSKSAGVFAGELIGKNGSEVILKNARRIWFWSGAASLSELSQNGVTDPENCKFPMMVPTITILEVIEILPWSEKSQGSINGVQVWSVQ